MLGNDRSVVGLHGFGHGAHERIAQQAGWMGKNHLDDALGKACTGLVGELVSDDVTILGA